VKVVIPLIETRMEERGQRSGFRIDSSYIGSLMPIAVNTRKGQIIEGIRTTMLFRDDVVDLERRRMQRRL
jgi:hypothetical protein